VVQYEDEDTPTGLVVIDESTLPFLDLRAPVVPEAPAWESLEDAVVPEAPAWEPLDAEEAAAQTAAEEAARVASEEAARVAAEEAAAQAAAKEAAQAAAEAAAQAAVEAEEAEQAADDALAAREAALAELNALKYNKLRTLAKGLGVSANGRREDIIARILDAGE